MKCFWTTCEACTQQCAWLLKRLVFAEVGDLTSWQETMNCYRATVVCLDAKGLWKPGQSFILAGFTLSLPCSAPCGTEQTTIDTVCDPALPRNCVDHPADCNLFKSATSAGSRKYSFCSAKRKSATKIEFVCSASASVKRLLRNSPHPQFQVNTFGCLAVD